LILPPIFVDTCTTSTHIGDLPKTGDLHKSSDTQKNVDLHINEKFKRVLVTTDELLKQTRSKKKIKSKKIFLLVYVFFISLRKPGTFVMITFIICLTTYLWI